MSDDSHSFPSSTVYENPFSVNKIVIKCWEPNPNLSFSWWAELALFSKGLITIVRQVIESKLIGRQPLFFCGRRTQFYCKWKTTLNFAKGKMTSISNIWKNDSWVN